MATPAQLQTIRAGLELHISAGARAWEFRELISAYAREMDVELKPGEIAALLQRA